MKSSIAFAALFCAPEVFAVALPHIPKLNSRWFHKDELSPNDNVHAKRDELPDHGKVLKPRQLRMLSPASITASSIKDITSTGTIGLLPTGHHPFIGHGPALQYSTYTRDPAPTPAYHGQNYTITYPATGTSPQIANATATIYIPPEVYPILNNTTPSNRTTGSDSCGPVPELIDDHGNFLPPDLQPKYNGSVSCTPANISLIESPPEAERIEVESHISGDQEIVEVEITKLPFNATSWNDTVSYNYGDYYGTDHAGPSGYPSHGTGILPWPVFTDTATAALSSDLGLPPRPTMISSGPLISTTRDEQLQAIPTSTTSAVEEPKVRRWGDEHASGLADLGFD